MAAGRTCLGEAREASGVVWACAGEALGAARHTWRRVGVQTTCMVEVPDELVALAQARVQGQEGAPLCRSRRAFAEAEI